MKTSHIHNILWVVQRFYVMPCYVQQKEEKNQKHAQAHNNHLKSKCRRRKKSKYTSHSKPCSRTYQFFVFDASIYSCVVKKLNMK